MASSTVQEMREGFLEYIEHGRNASEHTIRAYRSDLAGFFHFLGVRTEPDGKETGKNVRAQDIDPLAVRAYLAQLRGEGQSRRTIARKIAALRSFLNHLCRQGIVKTNAAVGLRTPRLERNLPTFLDEKDVAQLLDALDYSDVWGLRDRAILEILYSTGMRVSELTQLDSDQVDMVSEVIIARGKGKKERLVPVGRTALSVLEQYLRAREAKGETLAREPKALFINRFGTRLTARSVERMLEKYIKQVGLAGKVTPHTLRHSFATHMLNRGADLRSVQELLGHTNLTTTQIYTHVTTARMKETYDHTHPHARKSNTPAE